MRTGLGMIAAAALLTVAGCAGDANLYSLRSDSGGPDEFAILPTKPLEMPEDMAALPPPTPGATNLADPTPRADAIAALGGNPQVLTRAASDPGLIRYTTRYGVQPGIREDLAVADAEFRRSNGPRLLERLFNVSVYNRAYAPLSLDQRSELARFRRAGIPTPSAPPPPVAP
jgi:hypothetical protein